MNHLYHFRVFPWQMGRFKAQQLDAIDRSIEQMKKDAKGG